MDTPARALEALLGKTGDDYRAPGLDHQRLILYGAGNLGRFVLQRLRSAGIEPLAFADDTLSKHGQTLDGLPVFPPEEISRRFGPDTRFVVTILNPALRFLEAKENLRRRTGGDALSLFDLGRTFPNVLLPHLQYDRPERVLEKRSDIRRALDLFADQESRRQFVAHVEFRLTANYETLPPRSQPGYFPRDVLPELPANCIFVDCGAFDGDTIRQFLSYQGSRFGQIFAFEPDRRNYERLQAYVRTLDPEIGSRIKLHHAAVGDRSGEIAFDETGDMGAAVNPAGSGMRVSLIALNDVLPAKRPPTYIKLDVEGFEREALAGAAGLLEKEPPILAVSVYHRPEDLWAIPLSLHDLGVGYSFALRTEGHDGMDIVCYAIPPSFPRPTVA